MSSRVWYAFLAWRPSRCCLRQGFGAVWAMARCPKRMPTLTLPTSCQIFQRLAPRVGPNNIKMDGGNRTLIVLLAIDAKTANQVPIGLCRALL
jgi:hypothetical protein